MQKLEDRHTAGPWEIEPEFIDEGTGAYHEPMIMGCAGMVAVAVVRIGSGHDDANALVLAAAPELLASAKELLRVAVIKDNEQEWSDAMDVLERAVFKAEGKA